MNKKAHLKIYFLLSFMRCIAVDEKNTQQVKFSGYVRHSTIYDTRQSQDVGEGMTVEFPLPQLLDIYGNDINNNGQCEMLNVQSRLRFDIQGPELGSAHSRGFVECDFQGREEIGNLVKMRTAYVELIWGNSLFVGGQFDNPMYIAPYEPPTLTPNWGVPFNPYGPNPQLHYMYTYKKFHFKATAITQLERESDGPFGASTQYLRDAMVPNLDAQLQWHPDERLFLATSINFKRLVPRLSATVNNQLFKVYESINSYSTFALLSFTLPEKNFRLSTKIIYGQNLREYEMFSGYAVATLNPITGKQTYTNLQAVGWWVDLDLKYRPWFNPGIFIGYTKNLGFTDCVESSLLVNGAVQPSLVYSRAPTLDNMLGIVPRIYWYIEQLTIGLELQYNRASFGTINPNGTICDATPVNFARVHLALFYNF
jgi:hypothetical protein